MSYNLSSYCLPNRAPLFFEDLQKKAPALKPLPKISVSLGPGNVQTLCSVQVYCVLKKSRRVKDCWQFSIWDDVFIRSLAVLFSSPAPPSVCFMGRMWWKGCFISLAVITFHQWPTLSGMWLIHRERKEQWLLSTLCLMPKHLGRVSVVLNEGANHLSPFPCGDEFGYERTAKCIGSSGKYLLFAGV